MKTTKTLLLAAVSVLSIGAGAAMAQSEVPSAPSAIYFQQNAPRAQAHGMIQAGDSDVLGGRVLDFSTLANPG